MSVRTGFDPWIEKIDGPGSLFRCEGPSGSGGTGEMVQVGPITLSRRSPCRSEGAPNASKPVKCVEIIMSNSVGGLTYF